MAANGSRTPAMVALRLTGWTALMSGTVPLRQRDGQLDEVPRALVPAKRARLARRPAVRDDQVHDVRIRGIVAEHGARPILAREVCAHLRVRVVEHLERRPGS